MEMQIFTELYLQKNLSSFVKISQIWMCINISQYLLILLFKIKLYLSPLSGNIEYK